MIQDLASLLWVVNLGCIDLNQWYARCDDVNRPDYVHFDLDPVPGRRLRARAHGGAARARRRCEAGHASAMRRPPARKGIHVYVPIVRGPVQKQVWTLRQALRAGMEALYPDSSPPSTASRSGPPGRVLVDYNQNAWGRTLASVYSVRAQARRHGVDAGHLGRGGGGIEIEDFT